MNPYLNDYINALGDIGRKRAAYVLDSAKIQKGNLDALANRISSNSFFNEVRLEKITFGDYIRSSVVQQALHNVIRELNGLYEQSNNISLLMDSHSEILSSEIAELNEEIAALEKAVDNYAFLLADGGSYDVGYIEKFSDELGKGDLPFRITDRGNVDFFPWEEGHVDQAEGTLKISSLLNTPSTLNATILASNCSQYSQSSNSIGESVNQSSTTGWQATVSTPSPVTSKVVYPGLDSDLVSGGVQYLIEYAFSKPSAVDTISISPLARSAVEVLDIIIFDDLEGSNKKSVVTEAFEFTSKYTVSFPMQTVAKVWVVIRTLEYERPQMFSSTRELLHKIYDRPVESIAGLDQQQVSKIKAQMVEVASPFYQWMGSNRSIASKPSHGTRLLLKGVLGNGLGKVSMYDAAMPTTDVYDRGPFVRQGAMDNPVRPNGDGWFGAAPVNDIMSNAIKTLFTGTQVEGLVSEVFRREINGLINKRFPTHPIVGEQYVNTVSLDKKLKVDNLISTYTYKIGIKSFAAGTAISGFKGYFVSQLIPASGDINEVRLKAQDINFDKLNTSRDLEQVTSIEYSVTNQSRPDKEDLWIPILPVGTTTVVGERFFPDVYGKGYLRFPASIDGDIAIYKNGYLYTELPIADMLIVKSQTVIGLKIPPQSITPKDVFTCSYKPSGDKTVINFANENLPSTPLVSSFDRNGAGEGFAGTNNQLVIALSNHPYVDYSQVTDATYNTSYGLTPYNPITVRFEDGSLAYNLTNYKGGTQSTLDAGSDNYQYIHSGNTLMFNKPITDNIRVYYQYLPNNVRFRVVLRSNDSEFVSPKVDSVQVKGKSRKPDAKRGL